MDKIYKAQKALKEALIDGWLLYYFDKNNPLALDFLDLDKNAHLSRRLFYWIPQKGEPIKIVHTIEPEVLSHLNGSTITYHTKEQLDLALHSILGKGKKIAMEYSPKGVLPYISKVDAGMIEKIRNMGVEVVSSAPFLQVFTCSLNPKQIELQEKAARFLDRLTREAFHWTRQKMVLGQEVTEMELQEWMLEKYETEGFFADFAPTVAFGVHTADPHYMPSMEKKTALKNNQLILLDCVVKSKEEKAVYADITRMGFSGAQIPPKIQKAFQVILKAQEETFKFIEEKIQKGIEVKGYEADRVCRHIIQKEGFEKFFTHRTGHNLYDKVHGPGAHLDDFETFDDRPLIPLTSFTIEPGLYFPNEFGVRVEYDVLILEDKTCKIITAVQSNIFTF